MCAIFADSARRNVCESPIIKDRGISAGSDWVASGLWVVLKEKSMEIIKIA